MLPEFDRVDGAQSQRAVYPATSNPDTLSKKSDQKIHLGIKAVEACMHARKYGAMVLDPTWLPDAGD